MSEVETVEVPNVGTPLRAPVELLGRAVYVASGLLTVDRGATLQPGDVLIASPDDSPGMYRHWRTGRAVVDSDGFLNLRSITAICEGDYVYRIGRPTTSTLEERVAELEYEMARRLRVSG